MSGYNTVLFVRKLEEEVSKLGFMMCYPRHSWGADRGESLVAIKPKDDDSLPIYARDAELFCGTLEDLNAWIQGVTWARKYDTMLRVSDEKKRERKEQDVRNENLVRILRAPEVSNPATK